MRKLSLLLSLSILLIPQLTRAVTTHLTTKTHDVLKVDLSTSQIKLVSVPNGSPSQSVKALASIYGAKHAINGGYFCPSGYTRCTPNTTSSLRVSDGVLYSEYKTDIGMYKSLWGFTKDGTPTSIPNDGTFKQDDITPIRNGLAMPTLIQDGIDVSQYNDEMNKDPKQGARGTKQFICYTASNQSTPTVYMGSVFNVTFMGLADYVKTKFNCYNAIQLDSGGSRALLFNNSYAYGPGRAVMDAFVVIDSIINQTTTPIIPTHATTNATNPGEMDDIVTWMYNSKLTSKRTVAEFLPNSTMTREEAAKFFSVFAELTKPQPRDKSKDCIFTDIDTADPTLVRYISNACEFGIFNGSNDQFLPKQKLTQAQAVTVLMRIVGGQEDEPSNQFYKNYLSKATQLGIMDNINPTSPITRGMAGNRLFRTSIALE